MYTPPTRPPWLRREQERRRNQFNNRGNSNCDDDEEDCYDGSGDDSNDNRNVYYTVTPAPEDTSTNNWHHKLWDSQEEEKVATTTTSTPPPRLSTLRPPVIYENYDTKYNVYDEEPDPKAPPPEVGPGGGGSQINEVHKVSGLAPSSILVIGIIACSVVAMVAIVVIVLKTRTRVDGATAADAADFKVDGSRTYHFGNQGVVSAAPGGGGAADIVTPGESVVPELEAMATASGATVLRPLPAPAVVSPAAATNGTSNGNGGGGGGFYGSNLMDTANAMGAAVVAAAKNKKPFREWYV